jgi:hypothetical protein
VTTRRPFLVRLSTQYSVLSTLLLSAGCAQPAQSEPPQAVVAVTVAGPPADGPNAPQPGAAKPADSASAFEYPADLGGQAVAKAVAPDTPALTTAERFGTAPKPRTPPAKLLNPDPVVKVSYAPPPLLPAKLGNVRLAPPAEQVPPDLGNGAGAVPTKPTLPAAAGITERARDVNLPPAMPALGRPLAERVSLDDPTAEFGHAAVVAPVVKVPLAPAAFLKVAVPDPFELGDQVRPKVPPAAEPGLAPVPVNPQRVK